MSDALVMPVEPNPSAAESSGAAPALSAGERLRRDLRGSVGDAALFSIMVGLGETYFSAFVLALKGGEIASGLVTALPLLAGAFLQLATPWAVQKLGSHKRWVVSTALIQAFSLVLLTFAPLAGSMSVEFAFAAVTLYWGAGLATGPAWNTWIEGIVPRRVRTRFFARRVRVSQAAILLGFVAGGFLLQFGKQAGRALELFTLIFIVSAVCRFCSAMLLSRQTECPRRKVQERMVTVRQLLSSHDSKAGARLLTYLFSVQIAAYTAGPYFSPFMLSQMDMGYRDFALLIGVTFIGKVVALPFWGKVAHYAGPRKLLWIGGISIVPISGLWFVSRSYVFLATLQVLGGVTWAAYELALFLMFFETIPREERTSVLTVYNFGNSLSQVVGALIGAAWLRWLDRTYDAYLWLFVLSTVFRAMTIMLLARVPDTRRAAPLPDSSPVSLPDPESVPESQPLRETV